jgi:hypothetical protein
VSPILVALVCSVSLVVGLVAVCWLVRARRRRGPAHLFRGQGEAVTVDELLEEAKQRGEGVRLNWPQTDLDEAGLVRPYVQDQFPTAILPPIDE